METGRAPDKRLLKKAVSMFRSRARADVPSTIQLRRKDSSPQVELKKKPPVCGVVLLILMGNSLKPQICSVCMVNTVRMLLTFSSGPELELTECTYFPSI